MVNVDETFSLLALCTLPVTLNLGLCAHFDDFNRIESIYYHPFSESLLLPYFYIFLCNLLQSTKVMNYRKQLKVPCKELKVYNPIGDVVNELWN